jgi:hypothetical protein
MFWPEELGPISKDRCTILYVFLIFLNGFAINFFCLGVFVADSFLDLTPVLIGMVRCSRSSSILCFLMLFFLRWNI